MSNIRRFMKEKQNEKEPRTGKGFFSSRIKKILILAIVAAVIIAGLKLYFDYTKYGSYKVVNKIKTENINKESQYFAFAGGYLRYSNDGLSYIKGSEVQWNQAYELNSPLLDICGDYAAVGQKKSNQVYLFDRKGLVKQITTSYPLFDLEVSAKGGIYVLSQDEETGHLEAFNKEGEQTASGENYLEGSKYGYGVDCSVSEDGTKLAVAYLYVDGGAVQSRVVFYNFSKSGQNEVDNLVGGFDQYAQTQTIVPKVEFLDNDTVCAFGDDLFSLYSIKEKPQLIRDSEEFNQEIKSIFYSEKYIGLVFNNENTETPYVMHIYNKSGDKIMDRGFSLDYTDIKFAGNNILLYNNSTCEIYNLAGVQKFSQTFEEGIVYMTGGTKSNRYLIADTNSIEEIRLK